MLFYLTLQILHTAFFLSATITIKHYQRMRIAFGHRSQKIMPAQKTTGIMLGMGKKINRQLTDPKRLMTKKQAL